MVERRGGSSWVFSKFSHVSSWFMFFFPASSYSISCLSSWEILDGFPGFTLGGLGPAPLMLIPNNFYWDSPLLMSTLCIVFLSTQYLCLLVVFFQFKIVLFVFLHFLFYFEYTESSKKVEPKAVLCTLVLMSYVVSSKLLLNTYFLEF